MAKIKICLDAGHHGKYNQSNVVPAYYESDFNWKLFTALKRNLEEYGIEVISTRENQNIEMGTKTRGRKSEGCDLFISLHANWAERESADHVVVYEMLNTSKHDLIVKMAKTVQKVMGTKEPYDIRTRSKDSGGEWYGVLQGCAQVDNDSGFILEHSFYSNKAMATWMMNDDNIGKLAEAEAAILAEYFGVEKPVVNMIDFQVNDIVSIVSGAVYTTGKKVPSWVRKKAWVIKSVKDTWVIIDKAADGSNAINSPIEKKYLELVKSAVVEEPKKETTEVVQIPESVPEPTPETKPVITNPEPIPTQEPEDIKEDNKNISSVEPILSKIANLLINIFSSFFKK